MTFEEWQESIEAEKDNLKEAIAELEIALREQDDNRITKSVYRVRDIAEELEEANGKEFYIPDESPDGFRSYEHFVAWKER